MEPESLGRGSPGRAGTGRDGAAAAGGTVHCRAFDAFAYSLPAGTGTPAALDETEVARGTRREYTTRATVGFRRRKACATPAVWATGTASFSSTPGRRRRVPLPVLSAPTAGGPRA